MIDDRFQLLLHLVHGRLESVLVVELAHLPRDLCQQFVDALALLLPLLDAFLHQPAHSLLQVSRVIHVFVQLVEDGLRVEGIP